MVVDGFMALAFITCWPCSFFFRVMWTSWQRTKTQFSGPRLRSRYVFGLDFGQVVFGTPADLAAEVIVDKGAHSTVKTHQLVYQDAVEERKEDG